MTPTPTLSETRQRLERTGQPHLLAFWETLDEARREWKERGVGEARLLARRGDDAVRLLMRRDVTLKVAYIYIYI